MAQFSHAQIAQLRAQFLENLAGAVPGSTIEAGTIPFTAAIPGAFATGAQGLLAATAHAWGNHASAGYALNQAYLDTKAGPAATATLSAAPVSAVLVVVSGVGPVRVDAGVVVGTTLTFATPLLLSEIAHISYIGS